MLTPDQIFVGQLIRCTRTSHPFYNNLAVIIKTGSPETFRPGAVINCRYLGYPYSIAGDFHSSKIDDFNAELP